MANTSISNLAAGAAVSATDIVPNVQTAGVGPVKTTAAQLKTFMSDSPTLVTPTLGVASATSINKVAITAPASGSTLTIANGKTLTANNTLTLAGTDSTTITFPSTNATIARTDAGQTFTGSQTFNGDAFNFTSAASFSPLFTIWNQTAGANSAYNIMQKSRAASGAGAAVLVNDILGAFLFRGADTGGTFRNSSYMEAVVTAVGASSVDSAFRFQAIGATSYVSYLINGSETVRFDVSGNILLGTTVSPTTGTQCLTVETGTAPTATPADTVTIYSTDRTAGNTIPSIYCEGAGVTNAAITNVTVTNKIALRVNGTIYYLLATTSDA
jgi:hypothetical protein